MKTTKLVTGILMIILSVIILVQSMASGVVNAIDKTGSNSGTGGLIMAIAYLVAGIVYLATKSKQGLGGDIANAVILCLFGAIGLSAKNTSYADLNIWIILGFIIGIGFLLWHILKNKKSHVVQ